MDFQEFNELHYKKDENVIHLKYTENEDEREENESDKKRRMFSFDSPIVTLEIDASRDYIMERVLRDKGFSSNNQECKYNSQNTDGNISCQQRKQIIEQQNNELLQGIKDSATPQGISSKTNMGTFKDEYEKQQLRQIIYEMKNPRERLKLCVVEKKRSSIEELLRDINEANEITNPDRRKFLHHKGRTKHRGTIETPTQIQEFQLRMKNYFYQSNLTKSQNFEKNSDKLFQFNNKRDPINNSTNYNVNSQSPLEIKDYLSERQKAGSGDSRINNTSGQLLFEKQNQKTITRPFVLGKSCFYKEQEEIDSRGKVITQSKINCKNEPTIQKSAPLDQDQRRLLFKRDTQKQYSVVNQILKNQEKSDPQMLTSIRIEHPVSESNQIFLPGFKLQNIKSKITEEAEEYEKNDINSKLFNLNVSTTQSKDLNFQNNEKNLKLFNLNVSTTQSKDLNCQKNDINSKLFNLNVSTTQSKDKTEIYKSENNFTKNINNSENDSKKEVSVDELHIYTPFLGGKTNSISIGSPTKLRLNNLEKSESPEKKLGQEVKMSGEKVMFQIDELALTNKINDFKQRKKPIAIGELHSACEQPSKQQNGVNLRILSSYDPNAAKYSYPDATPFNPINTNQKLSPSFNSPKQSISKASISIDNQQKTQKTIGNSQNDDENMDTVQTSLGAQITQQQKFNPNKNRIFRSNTVFYDQEKKKNMYIKGEEINTVHNHVIQNDQPQEGCPACDFQKLMKISNQKDKLDTSEITEQNKLFKEIPLHAIEQKFFIKQVSLLNNNNYEAINDNDKVFVLGNKNQTGLTQIRVFFFSKEDVFLDFKINILNTTIQAFVKFAIQCFKIKKNLNQNLLKYPEQPSRYKVFPNAGENRLEICKPNMDIPEPSDNMMMNEILEDSHGNICCLVEMEDMIESYSMTNLNQGLQDLDEFQSVYNKSGQFVFKVECQEKNFYTFLRLDKDNKVEDIFEELFRKKKIDVDKKNFMIQGKVIGSDHPLELDLTMPLKVINNSYLNLVRREYEDRQGGTLEDQKSLINNTNTNLLNLFTNAQEDSIDQNDDEFDQDEEFEEIDYQNQFSYMNSSTRSRAIQAAKLFTQQHPLDPTQIQKYEEFEVIKESINNHKQQKRIIGIDGDYIYNRKTQPKLFSIKGLLCFLFPSSPYETKCPKKKIDDIKFMCVIEGGKLLIQFYEKDNNKQWLLSNPDPNVSKRMYQKLQYLRKSEVKIC